MDINLRRIRAEFRANGEKFEALLGTLVSRMDIHQARIDANQEKMLAKMDTNQEKWMPR
jgi:hypothetical protein